MDADSTPALPTGTVTFLFTDIEGSTKLLHFLGDRYAQVLADQRHLLRSAFEKWNGHEVDTQGDSFFVAFQNAGDALAAAVEIQRALLAYEWPENAKVRVRMGLHTGTPLLAPTGYVGLDVHRAARIAAAGHGGQVLLSQATRDTAANVLPRGASLRDLGEVRLKDFKRPERVYQLVALDLPSEFPPLKVLESLDSHYEMVVRALEAGQLVLFLGAGVNLAGRPESKRWQSGQFDQLPSTNEVAEHLATRFDYPVNEPHDLMRISEYIAVKEGIGPLYDELRKVLKADYPPTPLHQFLAALPGLLRGVGYPPNQLIITTNYDDALERAFRSAGEAFDLVYYVADGEHQGQFVHSPPDGKARVIDKPNKYLSLAPDQRTIILKLHGLLDRLNRERDSYVVTEDHYIDYLAHKEAAQQVPAKLLEKVIWSHLLFLGYSLRDWNLRVILHRIWGSQKFKYKSWAIHPKAQPMDKNFWLKRDVETLEVSLEEYVDGLKERIGELPPAPTST